MPALRLFAPIAAAAALLQSQVAAAQAPCLTEAEVGAMVGYAMPAMLNGVMERCRPTLSPRGWFATDGPALVSRYAARKASAWPAAKSAFLKLASDKGDKGAELLSGLPDSALQPFAEAMVAELVSSEIKPSQCVAIERATRILSPLPPENLAELAGFVAGIVESKPGTARDGAVKTGKVNRSGPGLAICRPEPG